MPRKLSIKQEVFCRKYFELGNASEAARQAGYSLKSAGANSGQILKSPLIKERLQEMKQIENYVCQKLVSESVMSVVECKQKLTEIARADITAFVNEDGKIDLSKSNTGVISELQVEDWRGGKDEQAQSRTKKIKLYSKLEAIDLLFKSGKIYSDGHVINLSQNNQKVEVNIANFNAEAVAKAILEAAKLGLVPAVFGGNGHGEDTDVLSSPTDIQTTAISEPQD